MRTLSLFAMLVGGFFFSAFSLYSQAQDPSNGIGTGKRTKAQVALSNFPEKTIACQSTFPSFMQGGGSYSNGSHVSFTKRLPVFPNPVLLADDFPVFQQATISSITVGASVLGGGSVDDISIAIFEDNTGSPGAEVFTETFPGTFLSSLPTTLTLVPSNCPVLQPGIYWMSIHGSSTDPSGFFRLWADPNTFGQEMKWFDPYLFSCASPGAWVEFNNCFPNPPSPGIDMIIEFCEPTAVPTLGQWGLIVFTLLVVACGLVVIGQRKLAFT